MVKATSGSHKTLTVVLVGKDFTNCDRKPIWKLLRFLAHQESRSKTGCGRQKQVACDCRREVIRLDRLPSREHLEVRDFYVRRTKSAVPAVNYHLLADESLAVHPGLSPVETFEWFVQHARHESRRVLQHIVIRPGNSNRKPARERPLDCHCDGPDVRNLQLRETPFEPEKASRLPGDWVRLGYRGQAAVRLALFQRNMMAGKPKAMAESGPGTALVAPRK